MSLRHSREAKGVDFAAIPEGEAMREGTAAGRGFAVSGGVAGAVADVIHQADFPVRRGIASVKSAFS